MSVPLRPEPSSDITRVVLFVLVIGALLLGSVFVALGAWQAAAPSLAGARRVLLASLLYLPVLLALLAFDRV